MKHKILLHFNHTLIVTWSHNYGSWDVHIQLIQEAPEPHPFVVSNKTLYSNYEEDATIVEYFLFDQKIGSPPIAFK
jgi:hypothetical protein